MSFSWSNWKKEPLSVAQWLFLTRLELELERAAAAQCSPDYLAEAQPRWQELGTIYSQQRIYSGVKSLNIITLSFAKDERRWKTPHALQKTILDLYTAMKEAHIIPEKDRPNYFCGAGADDFMAQLKGTEPTEEGKTFLRRMMEENIALREARSADKKFIEQLLIKVEQLEAKIEQLEAKNAQLETKITQLEAKNAQLETKITQLESGA